MNKVEVTGRLSTGLSLAAGAAIGALGMYFLDPHRGKARRAEVQRKAFRATRLATREVAAEIDNLLNRAKGLVVEAEAAIKCAETDVSDIVVAERVRSRLGHLTQEAHGIETEVVNGVVGLRGTISKALERSLLKEILEVPGVRGVSDHLVAA